MDRSFRPEPFQFSRLEFYSAQNLVRVLTEKRSPARIGWTNPKHRPAPRRRERKLRQFEHLKNLLPCSVRFLPKVAAYWFLAYPAKLCIIGADNLFNKRLVYTFGW